MRGTGRTHDFFESEFVNRFDGWSISFQTASDDADIVEVGLTREKW